jgi:phage-related protein
LATAATIAARLTLDTKDYDTGIQAAKTKAGDLSSKLKNVGGQMQKTGTVMTGAFTLPIVAGMVKSVMAASDLWESISAVDTVFGDASGTILEFGESSAEAVGMSQEKFNSLGIVTGSLLQNLGYDSEGAADATITLAERASDMAAVFNTDVDQALGAINSGLKGEIDPLESFGVKLNAASVNAKAMEMGLADTEKELTDNAKAQATLALIMEQTDRIQGTFTKEAESLGGSMRIVKAQIADAAATIGQYLLPYVTQLANWVSQLIERFTNLSPETQKIILVIGGVIAVIGPLLLIVGTLISAIGAIIPVVTAVAGVLTFPLIAIIAAVIAIIALLVVAWKKDWGGIQEKTKVVVEWIKGAIDTAFAFIQTVVETVLSKIRAFWDAHGEDIMAIISILWDKAKAAFDSAAEVIKTIIDTVLKIIKGFWDAHGDTVMEVVQNLWDTIESIFEWGKETLGNIIKLIRSALEGDWEAFGETLREIWDNTWELIKTALNNAWDSIKTIVSDLVDSVVNFFKETDWKQVGIDVVQGIANGIKNGASWAVNAILSLAQNMWNAITGFFNSDSPSKLFAGLGEGLPEGVAIGIDKMAKVPQNALEKMSTKLQDQFSTDFATGSMFGVNSLPNLVAEKAGETNFYITSPLRPENALTPTQTVKRLTMLYGVN